MQFSLIILLNSVLLGVGLAMDAFSVSVVNTLNEPKMKKSKMNNIALTFGIFQAVMPLIGWILVHTVVKYFRAFEKFIPWIALLLLGYIGTKMLLEGLGEKDGEEKKPSAVNFSTLIIQGVATSIDALSVGFTIADYNVINAVTSALIIAIVTYFISMSGLIIGRKFGTRFSNKASVLGGCILIGIGIEIFISGFFK